MQTCEDCHWAMFLACDCCVDGCQKDESQELLNTGMMISSESPCASFVTPEEMDKG